MIQGIIWEFFDKLPILKSIYFMSFLFDFDSQLNFIKKC